MTIEDKLEGKNKGLEQSVNTSYEPQAVPERITDIYFKPKSFERSGRMYEWLGVRYFKKALMGTVGRLLKGMKKHSQDDSNYFIGPDRNNYSLMRFEKQTRYNEGWHTPWVPYCAYYSADHFAQGRNGMGIFMAIAGLINAYASMLQRYNRARIYNTLEGTDGPKVWTGKTPE